MRMRRPHWGQMFWSWPQASAEDQPGYDEPKILILNSGCEILTQRGQWNGIAVKSTSGRICKRALPRKTPAPKDRRSDVNTTCKYKLERVSWSKKTIKYLFSKSLIISFYCNLNSGLQASKTKGPSNTQDPKSWALEDWWMPYGCDQSDTTEMDESFFWWG